MPTFLYTKRVFKCFLHISHNYRWMFTSQDMIPFRFSLKVLQALRSYPKKTDSHNMTVFFIQTRIIRFFLFFFVTVAASLHALKVIVGELFIYLYIITVSENMIYNFNKFSHKLISLLVI